MEGQFTGGQIAAALGGDCLADVAMLRAQPGLFEPVASGPVVSRPVSRLAADAPWALKAIRGPGQLPSPGHARRWELKRPRLWLFAVAGRIVRSSRRLKLRFATTSPWASQITAAIGQLQTLTPS